MSVRRWLPVLALPVLVMATTGQQVSADVAQSPIATSAPATTSAPVVRTIVKGGVTKFRATGTGSGRIASIGTEIAGNVDPDQGIAPATARRSKVEVNRSLAADHRAPAGRGAGVAGAVVARAAQRTTVQNGPTLNLSFDGLDQRDQRTANDGNQFTVEPPDQALCVGGGHVVEAVNDAFRVYRTADGSAQTGVESLNTFFGYPAVIDRATGTFGQFVTDPSCLFDPTTNSFFLTVLTLEVDPATGAFTGDNHLDIAVAKDPMGTWSIYRVNATDDGTNGTPVHPHCPCIGDYPHIGVDANGFFLTTNEYSFFDDPYNSAQVYAFSKRALAAGVDRVMVSQFDTTGADRGRNGFTVWPAQSPSTAQYASGSNGTEYFLSSNGTEEATGAAGTAHSNSIVTWSMTNTSSLRTSSPAVRLHNTRVTVAPYSQPPLSNQKVGPVPLADCLTFDPCGTLLLGQPDPVKPEVESALDSNDTRMQQVTYTGGQLYGALDTAVSADGSQRAGIAWFIVKPNSANGRLTAHLAKQGQFGLAGNNLIYPAIGLTAAGRGVMAFTLVGDNYYPSSAYASFDGKSGAGSIFLAKAGLGPQDGFSGYAAPNLPGPIRPRWGDYGATAVDGSGIWIASEYIGQTCTDTEYFTDPLGTCNGTRTALANWGTRVSRITP